MATPTNWDMLQAILLQLAHLRCRCLMGLPAHGTAFPPSVTPPGWQQGLGVRALPGQPAHHTMCHCLADTAPGPPMLCFSLKWGEEEGWECLVGSSEDLKSASKLTGPRKQGASLLGLEGAVGPGNLP